MPNTFQEIEVGDEFSTTHFISAEDVRLFAQVTGDDNPIHLDEEFARESRFGTRVVHGVLLLGVISKVLGHDYPGPGSIAVAMTAKFLRPVPVDSEVLVEVKVSEKIEKRNHVKARVYCYLEEQEKRRMVFAGDATILPPEE